jgi:ABC-2 type transport system ATP-binding protein
MGVTGQSNTLDSSCTVRENLYLHCRYHGMSRAEARMRAEHLLDTFRLTDKAAAKPAALSGGLARRLQLARAMAHEPRLLLLDEPTNELDALSQALFWEQIDELRISYNTAVLLATHLLEEAEQHCQRVLIVDQGRLILDGRPEDLRRRFRGVHTVTFVLHETVDRDTHTRLELLRNVVRCTVDGPTITVLLDSGNVPLRDMAELVQPFGVEEVSTRKASLREVFLDVIDTTAWDR